MRYAIIVAWHDQAQIDKFKDAWGQPRNNVIFQQDKDKEGCAVTKNRGIQKALDRGAEVVIVLDDDCYPSIIDTLEDFAYRHLEALEPVHVKLYQATCEPPSRGNPYHTVEVELPVAASMGFWTENPDYDAISTLVNGNVPPKFHRDPIFWRWFPFSGMNCAFKAEFWPHFKFDETAPRFDDIFCGYRLQAEAYKRGHCINLRGPDVRHVRQSNVWENLKIEAEFMLRNETEWQQYVYEASRSSQ